MNLTLLFRVLAVFSCLSVRAGEVSLEDGQLAATFDAESGALTRLENKSTHWVIERRPELGVFFKLDILVPGERDNYVLGSKQRAAEVEKISDQQLRLQWKDLKMERGGAAPITLTAIVSLTNGELRFDAALENNSPWMISTIDYPYLGDLSSPEADMPLQTQHLWYGSLPTQDVSKGPVIMSKQSLFCLIESTNQGLYVEMRDASQRYLLNFDFEPRRESKSDGKPAHVEFHTRHFIYAHSHTSVTLAPVVMRGYQGDWHAGVDCYKQWRNTWFKEPHLPDWARQVHSWTMLRMNTPEQDYGVPYTNFVSYAKEWAANNVRAVQVVGWNKGGQDGGDPTQDTDPGLGTWQQFHDAIAQTQAMGVKVILFAKLNWADLSTAWYSNELYKYECADQNGKRYEQGGYAYVTPTELADIGVHRRAVMDFLDPDYRRVALGEFDKILALGSGGWLWDEVCHHAGVLYNWAPNHGYTPPGYVYAGDLPLSAELRAAADKANPDFLFSGEGPQDWLMQYYPVSEVGVTAMPVCQYLDRHLLLLAGVSGFDDREQLNMILLRRCVIQYEPFLYKGRVSDFPLTLAYGKKIDALRARYKDFLWDGEFRDTFGANVTADGSFRYSVFVADSGKRAVVVINQEFSKPIAARVSLSHSGQLVAATPERPDGRPTTGLLQIPARSAVVLMEK
ncbi:MAG TPA: DUF6259 domain-containing protein [Verrucomicrobiae bacterium]|jgi:hypothetical protein|nr:DUF6259 domain-containing protein [Verrucomicrobiae bacterium]